MGISLVSASPICYDTGNFTTISTYGKNRDLILASLPPNASAKDACYRCVNSTIHDLITSCPNQKEGLSWENSGEFDGQSGEEGFQRLFGRVPAHYFHLHFTQRLLNQLTGPMYGSKESRSINALHNQGRNMEISLVVTCSWLAISLRKKTVQRPYLSLSQSLVAAASRCYDTGNFTTNSTYAKNRDLILASLPSNASANGGFFNDSVGQNSDQVYALAMCRGDRTPEDCYGCVNSSTYELMANCPNQKEASAWTGDYCLVHYADHSFFGTLELEPTSAVYNTGNITSNLTEFDAVWQSLINNVVRNASNGSSSLKYATGEADFGVFQKIYSLMQCTPDLSQQDCDYCLRQSAAYYNSCCHGKQGGVVQKPNCYFRWDLYPFYQPNASTSASLSPPPSPASPPLQSTDPGIPKEGGGISSGTIIIIVVSSVIFVAVLVILGVVLPKRIKKKKQNDQNNKTRVDSLQIDFNAVRVATENFSDANMLGRGGFGPVYKAWRNWNDGTALEFVDPILRDGSRSEIMRCIHLGLLCVQENIAYRPTMASVILMLSSYSISLPVPSRPAFGMNSTMETATMSDSSSLSSQSKTESIRASVNEVSISELDPR
ncbi:hypothetical protein V6N12_063021 [Hibiscus sabdariffa]|uniref:Gnk2-homologous domain-containing protein n=1 Tax=Hibiscus sabdariffa TaxID=183260 RepID=A0ABR2FAJ1_9ROSI